jgi:hypothetical protein
MEEQVTPNAQLVLYTILHLYITKRLPTDSPAFNQLVDDPNFDPNYTVGTNGLDSLLSVALIYHQDDLSMARVLVEKGALFSRIPPNVLEKLQLIAIRKGPDNVRFFLDNGVTFQFDGDHVYRMVALMYVTSTNNLETLRLLVERAGFRQDIENNPAATTGCKTKEMARYIWLNSKRFPFVIIQRQPFVPDFERLLALLMSVESKSPNSVRLVMQVRGLATLVAKMLL